MANLSVSGAVSGIDTASLITSLVQAQSNQQTLLKTQQKAQQTAADTMGRIAAALTTAGDLAGSLAKTSTWVGTSATSSSTSVTATAASGAGATGGSLTFDVTRVAAAHALVSADTVSSTSAVVASTGTLTLTASDGTTTDIAVGGGSLSEVVAAVNSAGKGVTAAAVQTSPGQYRLQLTATTTGAASQFTVDGIDGFTGLGVLTEGSDAALRIGGNPDTAYEILSPTNSFTGVLLGVALTVSKVETGVTVKSQVDGSAVADQVAKVVDAVNGALAQIGTATAYNATTRSGGPLLADATVRAVQQQLLDAVGGAGAAGVRLTRDGKVTFDRQAFLTAFAADPAKVKASFGAGATFAPAAGISGSVALSSSTKATAPGTYAVEVTARATREQWALPAASFGEGSVITLTRGSTTVSWTVPAGAGAEDAATALTARSAAAGLGIGVTVDVNGDLLLAADATGSAGSFTVDVDGFDAATALATGTDAAGTIDGQVATGVGDLLTLPRGTTGGAVGLALDTSGLADADIGGAVGTVTYKPGLASALSRLVDQYTATNTGSLTTAAKGRLNSVTTLQGQIDDWDRRLAAYRAMLSQQFTAMETAIATLKSQTSSISALVNTSAASSSSSS